MSKAITKEYLEKQLKNYKSQVIVKNFVSYNEGKLSFDGNELIEISDMQGENGKSAYEIAQEHGFEGSEEEWVESLKGKDGKSISAINADEENNLIITFNDGTTENIGKLTIDLAGSFLTEVGIGNLRFYNSQLQMYDEATSTWVDTQFTTDNAYVVETEVQPIKRFRGLYIKDTQKINLYIDESPDTIFDGQLASIVQKVVIKRKLGSPIEDVNDGEFVTEIKRKDFGLYKKNPYIDDVSVSEGEIWYYKAFPYNTNGKYLNSDLNEISIKITNATVYGFSLDQSESDPASMITYLDTCDNANFTPAYMNFVDDVFEYGSWTVENGAWFMDVKPCLLKSSGEIDCYLDPNDYTKDIDGNSVTITDGNYDGSVMVEIPLVYYKVVNIDDDITEFYFSNKKVDDDYVCWSHIDCQGNTIPYCYISAYDASLTNNKLKSISGLAHSTSSTDFSTSTLYINNDITNPIWHIETYSDRILMTYLIMLIGRNTNTQETFGNGYTGNSVTDYKIAGTYNTKGLFYGVNNNNESVKLFGIENLWGNHYYKVAGVYLDENKLHVKMTYDTTDGSSQNGYSSTGDGYICIENEHTVGFGGVFITKMHFSNYGFYPVIGDGTATTYFCDAYKRGNGAHYCYGGLNNNGGSNNGTFSQCYYYGYACNSYSGARISCRPLLSTFDNHPSVAV